MKVISTLLRFGLAATLAAIAVPPSPMLASSHREAPITALDHKADITDWFAFVSPEHPDRVILILNVSISIVMLRRIPPLRDLFSKPPRITSL